MNIQQNLQEFHPSKPELLGLENKTKCNVCNKSSTPSALILHKLKVHDAKFVRIGSKLLRICPYLRYYCPEIGCKYSKTNYFQSWKELKQHFSKVHVEKSLQCSICKRQNFSLSRDLKYHEKLCSQPKPKPSFKSGEVTCEAYVGPGVFITTAGHVSLINKAIILKPLAPKITLDIAIQTEQVQPQKKMVLCYVDESTQCWTPTPEHIPPPDMDLHMQMDSHISFGQQTVNHSYMSMDNAHDQAMFNTQGQQSDFFTQTPLTQMADAAVCTDYTNNSYDFIYGGCSRNYLSTNTPLLDHSQTQTPCLEDIDEILRHMQTQTQGNDLFTDIQTQTNLDWSFENQHTQT